MFLIKLSAVTFADMLVFLWCPENIFYREINSLFFET